MTDSYSTQHDVANHTQREQKQARSLNEMAELLLAAAINYRMSEVMTRTGDKNARSECRCRMVALLYWLF
jgi:hypothetical protein